MWSHYASNHCGFSMQFKTLKKPPPNALSLLFPVNYVDDFPILNFNEIQLIYDVFTGKNIVPETQDLMEKLYTRKSKIWQYENEWRNIQNFDSSENNLNNTGKVFPFDADQVENVYLGCHISTTHIDQIKHVLRRYSPRPKLYIMKMHIDRYELYRTEISY